MSEISYVTTTEAAHFLRLSRRTLEKMRLDGRGPIYRKMGRSVRYAVDDLTEWANNGARRSTSDPGPQAA